jgi:hypothetical protein
VRFIRGWGGFEMLLRVGILQSLFATVLILAQPAAAAFVADSDDRMVFRTEPPDPRFVSATGTAWNIYAEGSIDQDASKRLEQLIEQFQIPVWSTVYLNSPGGNPFAAMELGRVFRKHAFNTSVGKQSGPWKASAGECFSACTLAFLGGKISVFTSGLDLWGASDFPRQFRRRFNLPGGRPRRRASLFVGHLGIHS